MFERPKGMTDQDLAACAACGGPIFSRPMVYRMCIETHVVDGGAVQRRSGLELMLGGNARIASAFAADRELTHRVGIHAANICGKCMLTTGNDRSMALLQVLALLQAQPTDGPDAAHG